MIDPAQVQKRTILRCLTSPLTLLPVVVGVTLMLGQWALQMMSANGLLLGLTGIALGAGIFASKMIQSRDKIYKQVISELEDEEKAKREAELDLLFEKLSEDDDGRTDVCLQELRALLQSFREQQAWRGEVSKTSMYSIISKVEELFQGCVINLERTLTLHKAAESLRTKQAKKPLVDERERLIESVQDSIHKLSKVLAELSRTDDGFSVSDVQQELEVQLASAQEVDRRVRDFVKTGNLDLQ